MQHAFIRKDRLPKLENKYIQLPNRRLPHQKFDSKTEDGREPKISKSSSIARIRGTVLEEDKLRSYSSTPMFTIQNSSSFSRNLSNSKMYRAQSIQKLEQDRRESNRADQFSKSMDYNTETIVVNHESSGMFEDSEWSSVKDTNNFDNKLTPGFLEQCDSFSFGGSEKGEVRERFNGDLNLVSLKIPNPYEIGVRQRAY